MLSWAVATAISLLSWCIPLVIPMVMSSVMTPSRVVRWWLLRLLDDSLFNSFGSLLLTREWELFEHNLIQQLKMLIFISNFFTHFQTFVIQNENANFFDLLPLLILLFFHYFVYVVLMEQMPHLVILDFAVNFVLSHLLIKLLKTNGWRKSDWILFDQVLKVIFKLFQNIFFLLAHLFE